jgi:hypothetical protein
MDLRELVFLLHTGRVPLYIEIQACMYGGFIKNCNTDVSLSLIKCNGMHCHGHYDRKLSYITLFIVSSFHLFYYHKNLIIR